jgi:hypothetical protein
MKNYRDNKVIISNNEIVSILSTFNNDLSKHENAERLIDFLLACIDNIKQYGHEGDYEIFPDAFDEDEKDNFLDYVNMLIFS